MVKKYITVLSIAGSDSIGGAGIQADIKTCCALGVYGMTAITAITAQNTIKVASYEAVSPAMLKAQLESIYEDVTPDAVKIGMLPNVSLIGTVHDFLKRMGQRNVVVDPVAVATSGDALAEESAPTTLRRMIFPISTIITPNLPETRTLTGMDINSANDLEKAARILLKHVPAVLIKGGHGAAGRELSDTLFTLTERYEFTHEKIDTPNTHGTGCSLSTAIACHLAMGNPLPLAVENAVNWLAGAIESGKDFSLGHGHGPVNHNKSKSLFHTL